MLFLYLSCLVTFICVILVDGFDFEFENRTCSSNEDCPNTTFCIDNYCHNCKSHKDDCKEKRECHEPLTCRDNRCECVSGKKWLRNECVIDCKQNSDCPFNYYCDMHSNYCVENGLSPAQQGLIAFAIFLFLILASTVLYFTVERKIRRRRWKTEFIENDGQLSENQSRFDIDDEEGK